MSTSVLEELSITIANESSYSYEAACRSNNRCTDVKNTNCTCRVRYPCRPSLGNGGQQLRPVVLLATLNLEVLSEQLGKACYERAHGRLRHLETRGELSLSSNAYSIIKERSGLPK